MITSFLTFTEGFQIAIRAIFSQTLVIKVGPMINFASPQTFSRSLSAIDLTLIPVRQEKPSRSNRVQFNILKKQ